MIRKSQITTPPIQSQTRQTHRKWYNSRNVTRVVLVHRRAVRLRIPGTYPKIWNSNKMIRMSRKAMKCQIFQRRHPTPPHRHPPREPLRPRMLVLVHPQPCLTLRLVDHIQQTTVTISPPTRNSSTGAVGRRLSIFCTGKPLQ